MDDSRFTPGQVASRSSNAQVDKDVKQWLVGLPNAQRLDFLKQLWPLNFRYSLRLIQAAQLSRQENEYMFRHWLRVGHHNTAQELIKRFEPVLGERKFWQIASQETLSPTMREFMNYYGLGRLNSQHEGNQP
ncbi:MULTISPECIES: hypothetical protein [unclassified Pseudomonas]|uniref:hypothetical protein n=1 Tax=unclassified Pseudomonas TaxID=196821 RepID=UPI001193785C|nr:hypothetical protein [Pseudomonas sp. RGB]MCJ7958929.1 hypothetical protein [Pseudomonas sp.]TVT92157.1 hypothetical protein FPT15_03865 [Pseudomonas sp. RGB]